MLRGDAIPQSELYRLFIVAEMLRLTIRMLVRGGYAILIGLDHFN
jgi:hypothetical protein